MLELPKVGYKIPLDTGIWTHAESASSQKSIYRFADSMVSGCSFVSPAWRIDSSKGAYDKEKNTLALWNPRIYIGDVPVFYLPYLKVSLENKSPNACICILYIKGSDNAKITIEINCRLFCNHRECVAFINADITH